MKLKTILPDEREVSTVLLPDRPEEEYETLLFEKDNPTRLQRTTVDGVGVRASTRAQAILDHVRIVLEYVG